jgi:carboxypeptidase Q
LVRESSLLANAKKLQGFAFASTERNRVIGSPGHAATIKWLHDTLKKLPHYYNVTTQDFIVPTGTSVLVVDGVTIESAPMSFTASGHPVKPFVPVANIGCDAVSTLFSGKGSKVNTILRPTIQLQWLEILP